MINILGGTSTISTAPDLQAALDAAELALESARAARVSARELVRVCKRARAAARDALARSANPLQTGWQPGWSWTNNDGTTGTPPYQGQAKITWTPTQLQNGSHTPLVVANSALFAGTPTSALVLH